MLGPLIPLQDGRDVADQKGEGQSTLKKESVGLPDLQATLSPIQVVHDSIKYPFDHGICTRMPFCALFLRP